MNGTLQANFDRLFIHVAVFSLAYANQKIGGTSLFKYEILSFYNSRVTIKPRIEAIIDITAAFLHVS